MGVGPRDPQNAGVVSGAPIGFFEDIGGSHIKKFSFSDMDLTVTEIMQKIDPAIKNNNITHWSTDGCYM